jgi:hypothetical protein
MPYIHINSNTERCLEKYCLATGLTMENAVQEALTEWYSVMGEAVVTYSLAPRHNSDRRVSSKKKLSTKKSPISSHLSLSNNALGCKAI